MMRQNVTEAEWLDHKRRSLIDLARDAGVHVNERAQSYMLANKVRALLAGRDDYLKRAFLDDGIITE